MKTTQSTKQKALSNDVNNTFSFQNYNVSSQPIFPSSEQLNNMHMIPAQDQNMYDSLSMTQNVPFEQFDQSDDKICRDYQNGVRMSLYDLEPQHLEGVSHHQRGVSQHQEGVSHHQGGVGHDLASAPPPHYDATHRGPTKAFEINNRINLDEHTEKFNLVTISNLGSV